MKVNKAGRTTIAALLLVLVSIIAGIINPQIITMITWLMVMFLVLLGVGVLVYHCCPEEWRKE